VLLHILVIGHLAVLGPIVGLQVSTKFRVDSQTQNLKPSNEKPRCSDWKRRIRDVASIRSQFSLSGYRLRDLNFLKFKSQA